ncbi:MAG TPA: hypothetical protein VKY59_05700 [Spirillospora sp.]|nr:hypothetical protein [Spirillospora sp.]
MRPGLSRAVPLGILGFLVGMIILVLIRGLQQLEPLMDPELAFVLGAFIASGFFIYGMGAFDPLMNQHAHEPAEGEEPHEIVPAEEEPAPPGKILGAYIWQLATVVMVVVVGLVVFALLPEGPALRTVASPDGNVSAVGAVPIPIGNTTYYVSQLTFLIGFVIFMFLSLAVVAGGLGFVFFSLNQGTASVKPLTNTTIEHDPLEEVPATRQGLTRWLVIAGVVIAAFAIFDVIFGRPITNEFATLSFFLAAAGVFTLLFLLVGQIIKAVAPRTNWPWLVRAIIILGAIGLLTNVVAFVVIWFVVSGFSVPMAVIFNALVLGGLILAGMPAAALFTILAGILLPLFYFLLIGLIVPFAPPLLFGISAGNALLIAALIVRPKFLMRWLGYGAAWSAKQLRRLPNALQ